MRFVLRCSSKNLFDSICRTYFRVWSRQGYLFLQTPTKHKVLLALGCYRNGNRWQAGFVDCNRSVCLYYDNYRKFTTPSPTKTPLAFSEFDTLHVIYVSWCVFCSRNIYAGETANAFSLRVANRLSTIRRNGRVAVLSHFTSAGCSSEDVRFFSLQFFEHLLHLFQGLEKLVKSLR